MNTGPGAMSAGILLAANTNGNPLALTVVVGALAAVMALTLGLLLLSHQLNRVILLSGIAVQAVFDGLEGSGLLRLAN